MAKPAKAAAEESEAPAKPKGKRILLAVVALLVLGALGGGGWFLFKSLKHGDEPKPVVKEKAVFMDMEPFTVNLQHEEAGGGDQFLQVGITLKLSGMALEEKIKERLPEVRSRLLFLLSSKRPSELVPIAGKKKLARDIAAEINTVLGIHEPVGKMTAEHVAASEVNPAPAETEAASAVPAANAAEKDGASEGVLDVLFTSFIIQ